MNAEEIVRCYRSQAKAKGVEPDQKDIDAFVNYVLAWEKKTKMTLLRCGVLKAIKHDLEVLYDTKTHN